MIGREKLNYLSVSYNFISYRKVHPGGAYKWKLSSHLLSLLA